MRVLTRKIEEQKKLVARLYERIIFEGNGAVCESEWYLQLLEVYEVLNKLIEVRKQIKRSFQNKET